MISDEYQRPLDVRVLSKYLSKERREAFEKGVVEVQRNSEEPWFFVYKNQQGVSMMLLQSSYRENSPITKAYWIGCAWGLRKLVRS